MWTHFKFFDATARAGLGFALAALVFTGLDPRLFQNVIVAGLIGGLVGIADLVIFSIVHRWLHSYVERR